jgi:hypothetical protein
MIVEIMIVVALITGDVLTAMMERPLRRRPDFAGVYDRG